MMEIKNPWRKFRGLHKGSKVFQDVVKIMEQEREKANANDDVIPRSSLPALPENLKPPFTVTGNIIGDKYGMVLQTYRATEATFLAALLNAVYGGAS